MTARGERRPAFMVIGAVKAATTWLAHQLHNHPLLWLPAAEPHYFSTEYHRGPDWYRDRFADAPEGLILGEKSADYFADPRSAARIAEALPGIPLILQLRNPVDRAYSEYCMLYRRGDVSGDAWRHLDPRTNAESRFLAGGRYAEHLSRLFASIAPDRVKIILHEDIGIDPDGVVAEVFDHIGVPVRIAADQVAGRHNDSRSEMLPLSLRRLLRPARPVLDPLRAVPVLAGMRAMIARPVRYPPLDEDLRTALADHYRDDVAALAAMLGRDLGAWLRADAIAA